MNTEMSRELDEELNSVVIELKAYLLENDLTISGAESLTGGLIGNVLTWLSGSSSVFQGSICAYNIDAKVNLLGVDRAHAQEVDCISPQVALEMARGSRKAYGSDVAYACTGYITAPSPDVGPYCFFAIVSDHIQYERRLEIPPQLSRREAQWTVALAILENLNELHLTDK